MQGRNEDGRVLAIWSLLAGCNSIFNNVLRWLYCMNNTFRRTGHWSYSHTIKYPFTHKGSHIMIYIMCYPLCEMFLFLLVWIRDYQLLVPWNFAPHQQMLCEADFERWLINHLNSIDLNLHQLQIVLGQVTCGRDACVIDWQIPIFLTLMVWRAEEYLQDFQNSRFCMNKAVKALNYWICFSGAQHLEDISLDDFSSSNNYINKNFNWILSQFI